jgi:hypothetical protein
MTAGRGFGVLAILTAAIVAWVAFVGSGTQVPALEGATLPKPDSSVSRRQAPLSSGVVATPGGAIAAGQHHMAPAVPPPGAGTARFGTGAPPVLPQAAADSPVVDAGVSPGRAADPRVTQTPPAAALSAHREEAMPLETGEVFVSEEELAAQMEEDLRREEEHQRFLEREGWLQPDAPVSAPALDSQAGHPARPDMATAEQAAPQASAADTQDIETAHLVWQAEIEAANEAQLRFEEVQQTLLRMEYPEMFPPAP